MSRPGLADPRLTKAQGGSTQAGFPGGVATPPGKLRFFNKNVAQNIYKAVKRNPEERLVALLHHITVPVLAEAFYSLKSDVAAGLDGVTWEYPS